MKKIFLVACSCLSLLPSFALAKSNRQLSEYFQEQIQALNRSIVESEDGATMMDSSASEMWHMNQFSLRLRASLGFGIEGFASFQIVPETEMIWQRASPDGWVNYKPGM